MKVITSEELKSRLTSAESNGSIIAGDILAELKKNADALEILRGNANYFSTKRKKEDCSNYQKVRVVFTACTKDLTNKNFPDRNNPEAPWFSENRTDVEPSTFVGYFKNLPEYPQKDIDYFINAICVNSKVTVKLYDKMSDFYEGYLAENYIGIAQFGVSSLHGSCMKDENCSRNAADFYRNFAGAKIIIAKDAEKNVLGRAIVWENVSCMDDSNWEITTVSVLDRVYYSHDFIIKIIRDYAQSIGISLRKKNNDNDTCGKFVALKDIEALKLLKDKPYISCSLSVKVPATQWHKKGAPYLDTFYAVSLLDDDRIYLKNGEDSNCFATCRQTGGFALKKREVCPSCGIAFCTNCNEQLCSYCKDKHCTDTAFGEVVFGRAVEYKGKKYPHFLFKKGRPNQHLKLYLQINKLYGNE
jgi:hypothetical protein